jgi:tryptophan-rich sensory protein
VLVISRPAMARLKPRAMDGNTRCGDPRHTRCTPEGLTRKRKGEREMEYIDERANGALAMAGFGAAVAAAAGSGAVATPKSGATREWYDSLDKPPFTPPRWVFPVAWTTLYTLMAASAYRVWRAPDSPARTRALALWGTQLAANAAWSPLFFAARNPKAALADLGVLLPTIAAYTAEARKVDPASAWMMAPYLAWVGFAGVLNAEIVRRNRDDGGFTLPERAEPAARTPGIPADVPLEAVMP